MSKNNVQFQQGYSLFEFIQDFGTVEQCERALFKWRWPLGFSCPNCKSLSYCKLKTKKLYQCNYCHHQTSLISRTIFASSKLPLTTWFLAMYLITQAKNSISALELKRQLGVSYNTAWSIKQKLMQVMKEQDDAVPLEGIIQLDDVYWGGENRGGRRGRGSENKTPFVAAISLNKEGHPMRMNMNVVSSFTLKEIERWSKSHLMAGSLVISDGLACFRAVEKAGCNHLGVVTAGRLDLLDHKAFKWVNTMISNVKNSIRGTCHAVSHKHLPRYVSEFCYRFNQRFDLRKILPKLACSALRTPPMPGRLLKLADLYG